MPLKELIEMEKETKQLTNGATVTVHNLNGIGAFSIDFDDTEYGFVYYYLTQIECIALAQMLLRISDTKEGDKE